MPIEKKISTKFLLLMEDDPRHNFESPEYDAIHVWPQVLVGIKVNHFLIFKNPIRCLEMFCVGAQNKSGRTGI